MVEQLSDGHATRQPDGEGSAGTRSTAGDRHVVRLTVVDGRNYCYYMARRELKVARIGNSRGVRLPAKTLDRYGIGESVIMEERSDGILLRPSHLKTAKLSWDDTAREMATASEDWSEWNVADSDGLDTVPWKPVAKRVAERAAAYTAKRKK
jgi:antitoxin component of MazEF toxin-antitoxin module